MSTISAYFGKHSKKKTIFVVNTAENATSFSVIFLDVLLGSKNIAYNYPAERSVPFLGHF